MRKDEIGSSWPQGDKVRVGGWRLLGAKFGLVVKNKTTHPSQLQEN